MSVVEKVKLLREHWLKRGYVSAAILEPPDRRRQLSSSTFRLLEPCERKPTLPGAAGETNYSIGSAEQSYHSDRSSPAHCPKPQKHSTDTDSERSVQVRTEPSPGPDLDRDPPFGEAWWAALIPDSPPTPTHTFPFSVFLLTGSISSCQ